MHHRREVRPAGHLTLLSGNATVRLVIVLLVTVVVALATVVNMMQGDYTNLLIGLVVGMIAVYIGGLWTYSWFAAILIGMLGFFIAPTSFLIPADFQCFGLALGMAFTVLMRRALGSPSPPLAVTPGLNPTGMVVLMSIYFIYLFFQGMAGEVSPVYAGQYNIRNTAKAYAEDMLPVLTLIILMILRYRLPPMGVLAKAVTPAMLGALLALCSYRIYQITQGSYEVDETSQGIGPLIPVINLSPSEYALRVASPIGAIWGASRLFSSNAPLPKGHGC